MSWLGDACTCRCGWACDQIAEDDKIRVCEKCGIAFERKSYGWCQMEKIEPKRLVEANLCVSFSEARRMIQVMPEAKLLVRLQAKEAEKWGRRKVRTDGKDWKNVSDRFE